MTRKTADQHFFKWMNEVTQFLIALRKLSVCAFLSGKADELAIADLLEIIWKNYEKALEDLIALTCAARRDVLADNPSGHVCQSLCYYICRLF